MAAKGAKGWLAALILSLSALTLAAPAVAAAAMSVQLDVTGPARFQGDADLSASLAGSMLDSRDGPANGTLEAWGALRYRVLEYNVTSVQASATPFGRIQRADTPVVVDEGDARRIQAAPSQPFASLRVLGGAVGRLQDGFTVEPPVDVGAHYLSAPDPEADRAGRARFPAAGARLSAASIDVACRCTLFLFGADVQVDGRSIVTGTVDAVALDGAGATIERRRLVEATGDLEAVLRSGSWRHFVEGFSGTLDGDLELQDATGNGRVNGSAIPPDPHLFQAIGALTATMRAGEAGSHWDVDGSPAFVAVNARPVAGSRPYLQVAVLAGAGAGLLAALGAALARNGSLAVPGLNLAEPLGNERRVRLLELIAREPGLGQSALASRSAIPRPVVRHHLRILLRAGLITERPVANRKTYTLNDGSFEFALPPAPGSAPSGLAAAPAFAHFRQPVCNAILQAIVTLGPCSGREMRSYWARQRDTTISRPLLSHHIRKLHRLGLLERREHRGRVVWALSFDHAAALRHHKASFLATGGFKQIADALRHGPLTVDALYGRLRGDGPSKPRSMLAAQLRTMEAVGYVGRGPDGLVRLLA